MPTSLASTRPLSITRNRVAVVFLAVLAVLVSFAVRAPASRADNSSTLTITGTSDVKDSGLFANVLEPDFTAFYNSTHPGANLSVGYVSGSSLAAIHNAEGGTASVLLVHAASLENQFVGGGFSEEPFGRAIFHGDFVLLGPKTDPAGVDTTNHDQNNVVGAFEDIATAGAAGHANFVSRNDGSGTNVQEHLIWAATNVTGCTVSDANGGGVTPSTTTGDCPQTAPSWYQVTGDTQAANVQVTNDCNFPSNNDNCYTLTDRGTFDNLENENAIPNLKVVTEDNSTSAPGGVTELVNSFHAYAVNPSAVPDPSAINLPAAESFLNWVTSPAGQTDVDNYLKTSPGGAPFLGDATPAITLSSSLPKTVAAGTSITIRGTLSNVVPGTPKLAGEKVTLGALRASVAKSNPQAKPVTVATTSTGPQGRFVFKYVPNANARYTVSTGKIIQIEDASLHPVFGDILGATSKSLGRTNVRGVVNIHKVSAHSGAVTIKGGLTPAATGAFAHLSLYAAHSGHALKFVGKRDVKAGKHNFVLHFHLARGFTWRLTLKYVNAGQSLTGTSAVRRVTVS